MIFQTSALQNNEPEYVIKKMFLIIFCSIFLLSTDNTYSQFFEKEDSFIEKSGDASVILLPVSAFATSLILKDKTGSWQFTKGFLLNLAVTGAGKYLINKERPLQGGGYAFPSGHTSVAFQGASFFHRRYGFKYSIPAYILAGFTGYSRLNAKRHDGWDVLAGAAIGIGSTFFFTTPYENKQMEVTFSSGDNAYLVGFRYTF
ncbi:phosphatase PAP2 family protein [Salegentibacter salegens]|uniref:PAP2 superfamily protein n=1 Tax=Salegentibacter salegens TaxID=143223 RepID=A0A1M7K1I8_9FLAO|nr:phosphatase PAP2 family protein [Salegentibacter salegens]PRX42967.1 PAP2 superfamily protein [Salegentibacter salegens]SHM59149.1 PAP2 superfamily protein [Salegentibacter salegens]